MSGANATLKCVIAWSERRNLCSLVENALQELVPGNVLRMSDDALIVHTADEPAALRDRARGVLEDGESVIVFEFERWSGHGPGVDAEWLLRRGH
jgi:hypothetical protein